MPQFVTIMGQHPTETLVHGGPKFKPVLLNADGTLASSSPTVSGVLRTKVIQVLNATAPTEAGTGTAIFTTPGVSKIAITGGYLGGTAIVGTTVINTAVRWALNSLNDAAAALRVPATPPGHSATVDLGMTGMFNIPLISNSDVTPDLLLSKFYEEIPVDTASSGNSVVRIDFGHNLGTGVELFLFVSAIEET